MLTSKRLSVRLGWMMGVLGLLSAGCDRGSGLPTCDTPSQRINNCVCPNANPLEPVFTNPKSMCCGVDHADKSVCQRTSTTNPSPDAGMALAPTNKAGVLASALLVDPPQPSPCSPFRVIWTWKNYGDAPATSPTGAGIPSLTITEVSATGGLGVPVPIPGNYAWSAGLAGAGQTLVAVPVPGQGANDISSCNLFPTFIVTLASADHRIDVSTEFTLSGASTNSGPPWGMCAKPNSPTCMCDETTFICGPP